MIAIHFGECKGPGFVVLFQVLDQLCDLVCIRILNAGNSPRIFLKGVPCIETPEGQNTREPQAEKEGSGPPSLPVERVFH